jgi:hypothetical protein
MTGSFADLGILHFPASLFHAETGAILPRCRGPERFCEFMCIRANA